MPRAEAGSLKAISNKMKSKGLQRLRWYCQVCEKQCRDENGFKCHTQSESHVRNMAIVGSNSQKYINDYSRQFQQDFLNQLKTSHNTKPIGLNRFYNEYIAHKEHIHMNATRWNSLTEFAKYLGREGICRVQESEDERQPGLQIAWIDRSPEALRREEAIRKQERMEKSDEQREQKLLQAQIKHAQETAKEKPKEEEGARELQRADREKIKLNFGMKPVAAPSKPLSPPQTDGSDAEQGKAQKLDDETSSKSPESTTPADSAAAAPTPASTTASTPAPAFKMSFGSSTAKPKNVLSSKNNPLKAKKKAAPEPPKKMSEQERIMREEMEMKRKMAERSHGPAKRARLG